MTDNDGGRRGGRAPSSMIGDVLLDLDSQIELYDQVKPTATRVLKRMGIPALQLPSADQMPTLERPPSQMTNDELGDKQAEFSVWIAYIGPLLGDAKNESKEMKSKRDLIFARLKDHFEGTKDVREARAKADARYIQADADMLVATRVADELEAHLKGLETQRLSCSRYTEIRTTEIKTHSRTENVQGRRYPGQGPGPGPARRFRRPPKNGEEGE